MEITALIKWNGLLYFIYYGVNLAYDYLRNSKKQQPETIHYSYEDMLKEAPVRVAVPRNKEQSAQSVVQEISAQKDQIGNVEPPVIFESPVEDQGVPFEAIMRNAKSYSQNIPF